LHEELRPFLNLLNGNAVNLHEIPLGNFDTSVEEVEGYKGDGEEGGGAQEVQKIEKGVFDSSQTRQRKKTINNTDVEDACVVTTHVKVCPSMPIRHFLDHLSEN
jgi:hypothetical protein